MPGCGASSTAPPASTRCDKLVTSAASSRLPPSTKTTSAFESAAAEHSSVQVSTTSGAAASSGLPSSVLRPSTSESSVRNPPAEANVPVFAGSRQTITVARSRTSIPANASSSAASTSAASRADTACEPAASGVTVKESVASCPGWIAVADRAWNAPSRSTSTVASSTAAGPKLRTFTSTPQGWPTRQTSGFTRTLVTARLSRSRGTSLTHVTAGRFPADAGSDFSASAQLAC